MINLSRKQKIALGIAAAVGVTAPVLAAHSWSNYHWSRTTAELTIPVGDNEIGRASCRERVCT